MFCHIQPKSLLNSEWGSLKCLIHDAANTLWALCNMWYLRKMFSRKGNTSLSWHIFQVKCCSWICVFSVCMSAVSFCFVASPLRCVYVCVCLYVCVRACHSQPRLPLQPRLLSHGSFTLTAPFLLKTLWCKVAKLKGATPLYFAYFGSLSFFLLFISFTCKNTLTC